MRYKGPDSGNHKITIPRSALKYEKAGFPWEQSEELGPSPELCVELVLCQAATEVELKDPAVDVGRGNSCVGRVVGTAV